jgi:hypothetical protein
MTRTHDDALAKAVAYLGAIEVAPEYPECYDDPRPTLRYAVRGRARYLVFGADALEELAERNRADGSRMIEDVAEVWADRLKAVAMPEWWNPEHRTLWREYATGKPPHGAPDPRYDVCFTVDLTTGEEVPA